MEDYNYILTSNGELYHYGVKGMKWGVNKAREASRDLDRKERAFKRAKRVHAMTASIATRDPSAANLYLRTSSANELKDARRTYKDAKREFRQNAPTRVKVERGAKIAAKSLAKIGTAYAIDQKFNNGRGTKAVKDAIKVAGILTVSAVAKARGATDIHWYDKDGRKIV